MESNKDKSGDAQDVEMRQQEKESSNNNNDNAAATTTTPSTSSAAASPAAALIPITSPVSPGPVAKLPHPPLGGQTWYVPAMFDAGGTSDPEWRWGAGFDTHTHVLQVRLYGRCIAFHVPSAALRLLVVPLLWFTLFVALPQPMAEPGGYVFDPVMIVFCATLIGGFVCRFLQVPPLAGVLWVAIFYNNINGAGYLTEGVQREVRQTLQRLGLTVILSRSGLALDVGMLMQHWKNSAGLAIVPMFMEAWVHALVAMAVFGFDNYTWAFLQGFLVTAIAPGVVVPAILQLQGEGFATKVGPSTLMLSSVALDTVASVWAVSFMLQLLFPTGGSVLLLAFLGPVQIIGGAIIGVAAGYVFHYAIESFKAEKEASKTDGDKTSDEEASQRGDVDFKILVLFVAVTLFLVFLGKRVNLPGGGAVGAMVFSVVVGYLWGRDKVPRLLHQKRAISLNMAALWDELVMPCLFSMTGTVVDLTQIFSPGFFFKGLLCIVIGAVARWVSASLCTLGMDMSPGERFSVGAGWIGKAAVQAAMGGIALEKASDKLSDAIAAAAANATAAANSTDIAALQNDVAQGRTVLQVSILSAVLFAPISATLLVMLGRATFRKDKTT